MTVTTHGGRAPCSAAVAPDGQARNGVRIMNTLKIVTLSTRELVELGTTRYYLPPSYEPSADQGDVIIVAPVSADFIGARGDDVGSVHVITSQGSRVVDTIGLGVLVVPSE